MWRVPATYIKDARAPQSKHLLLGTQSFMVCFAAWGLISAFAPHSDNSFTSQPHRQLFWSRFRFCWALWHAFR